jgi:hypothetical protein
MENPEDCLLELTSGDAVETYGLLGEPAASVFRIDE